MGNIKQRSFPGVVLLVSLIMIFSLSCLSPQSSSDSSPSVSSGEPSVSSAPIRTFSSHRELDLLADEDPAKIDNSTFPITPVEDLRLTIKSPPVDIDKYRLSVDGLVNKPLSLSYEAVLKEPAVSEVVLLICPGVFVDNARWTGVLITTILSEAEIKPEANQVVFHALDGFESRLSLPDVLGEGVSLAHTVNGQILPADHGYPLRLVVKGKEGSYWVKWVTRIEIK
jgi:DMSO/TMAO reductase YedYZ molybdopterin-dependent catalytic subunit